MMVLKTVDQCRDDGKGPTIKPTLAPADCGLSPLDCALDSHRYSYRGRLCPCRGVPQLHKVVRFAHGDAASRPDAEEVFDEPH